MVRPRLVTEGKPLVNETEIAQWEQNGNDGLQPHRGESGAAAAAAAAAVESFSFSHSSAPTQQQGQPSLSFHHQATAATMTPQTQMHRHHIEIGTSRNENSPWSAAPPATPATITTGGAPVSSLSLAAQQSLPRTQQQQQQQQSNLNGEGNNSYRVEIGSSRNEAASSGRSNHHFDHQHCDDDEDMMAMSLSGSGEEDNVDFNDPYSSSHGHLQNIQYNDNNNHMQTHKHFNNQQQHLPQQQHQLHSQQQYFSHHPPVAATANHSFPAAHPHHFQIPNAPVSHSSISSSSPAPAPPIHPRSHHFEIGASPLSSSQFVSPPEKMEGVTLGPLGPLVVIDGANVAYAYADAMGGGNNSSSSTSADQPRRRRLLEPNVMGIQVAVQYFLQHQPPHQPSVRVLVVLPASYVNVKPPRHDNSNSGGNARMQTDQWDLLQQLKQQGKLVLSPPADDDDAYVLTIGLREINRQRSSSSSSATQLQPEQLGLHWNAYCVSNDFFRDAQGRNAQIQEWLNSNNNNGPKGSSSSSTSDADPNGRISYTFVDMGQINDHGERILDFVPNPRHELIVWMEQNNIIP